MNKPRIRKRNIIITLAVVALLAALLLLTISQPSPASEETANSSSGSANQQPLEDINQQLNEVNLDQELQKLDNLE